MTEREPPSWLTVAVGLPSRRAPSSSRRPRPRPLAVASHGQHERGDSPPTATSARPKRTPGSPDGNDDVRHVGHGAAEHQRRPRTARETPSPCAQPIPGSADVLARASIPADPVSLASGYARAEAELQAADQRAKEHQPRDNIQRVQHRPARVGFWGAEGAFVLRKERYGYVCRLGPD